MSESDAPFQRRPVQIASVGETVEWGIAVETPVEIRLNGAPWTVMLATPTDVEDLAVGLALTEELVSAPDAIRDIGVSRWLGEVMVDLTVVPEALRATAPGGRALAGNSGCGLCGIESLAAFQARQQRLAETGSTVTPVHDEAITRAFAELPSWQPVNRSTFSVHAAAWCRMDGSITLVREDVGRHNALDKLVGALARAGRAGEAGFVAMTSRCSYELVSKAAVAGAQLLATISAPTTLALTWSHALGVPLACVGPQQSIVRFPEEIAHVAG